MIKCSLFIFNVFVNSLLSFFTLVIFIKIITWIFRIQKGRIATLLLAIPILKLPIDLFLYDFSRWSFLHGINPIFAPEGTRYLNAWLGNAKSLSPLSFSGINFTVENQFTFSVADILAFYIPPTILLVFSAILVTTSLLILGKFLIAYRMFVNKLPKLGENPNRKIQNPYLSSFFKNKSSKILCSSQIESSPFTTRLINAKIYLSKKFVSELTDSEYDAVLLHELQHIRYHDTLTRFILHSIRSLFWWIPMKWLIRQIEETQEIASDHACYKYGVEPIDLASAMVKSARKKSKQNRQIFALNLTKKSLEKRIFLLLHPRQVKWKSTRIVLSFVISFSIIAFITLGRYWIF